MRQSHLWCKGRYILIIFCHWWIQNSFSCCRSQHECLKMFKFSTIFFLKYPWELLCKEKNLQTALQSSVSTNCTGVFYLLRYGIRASIPIYSSGNYANLKNPLQVMSKQSANGLKARTLSKHEFITEYLPRSIWCLLFSERNACVILNM